ncbi:MAG: phosphatidylserine/phosphatidylglycerophosphate/cardiolipin synthase family protein [Sphaerochaetaceae bacterium]|nr:phosphatidylserine/phosphatidylglycerophosphate/cardiolipin synthase family protein [Sphaerochaetaceae bacterium]
MEDKGYSSVSTGTPEFFYDGRSWKDELIELIEASNDSILVSTFLGNEHFSTDEIWQALKAKADSGVAVYIIIDASSQVQEVPQSPERVKSALYMLKDMGMNVVEYNPYSISNGLFLPNLFDRDHRKYFVFDSHTVALGGININHTSLYYPGGRGHIDLMGVMESPELASLLSEAFVDTYNRYTPYPVELDELFTSRIGSDNGQDHTAYLFNHYYQTGSTIEELFDIFAVLPKKEIWFVQGYTFLTPRLLGRIEHLEAQGVDVNVILSENGSKDKYNKAALYNILPLIEAGATVYLYDAPDDAFLHQKAIVADGRYVTFGSANYNFRSETLSRELNLFYDDEKIAEDLMGFIEILLADARIISAEEAARWRGFSYWYLHMVMQVWG